MHIRLPLLIVSSKNLESRDFEARDINEFVDGDLVIHCATGNVAHECLRP